MLSVRILVGYVVVVGGFLFLVIVVVRSFAVFVCEWKQRKFCEELEEGVL